MYNFIITNKDTIQTNDINIVGGKGLNLFFLSGNGCNVPPFIVISTEMFSYYTKNLGDRYVKAIENIDVSTPAAISKTASAIRELFNRDNLGKELSKLILDQIKENIGECFLAIRSSATTEDSKDFSFAGQLDSYLFCKREDEILESIVKCWASLFSDRAVAYRNAKNIPQDDVKVAVVIQKMIDGKTSGITFTTNPITKRVDELLINAVYGLGEGIVSGELNSDQYVCYKDKFIKIARSEITSKKEKLVFKKETGHGTVKVEVEQGLQDKPCLMEKDIIMLADVCNRIEKLYGKPQDIEWTIDSGKNLYILQSRPITTIDKVYPSERDYKTIWDNSNITESYSGVTSPLTFSFALNAYHMVYVQFCEVLKVPKKKIIENDFYFANMLGLLNGRVYYNIKNWCRLISLLPGYNYNRSFMEQMMGVKEKIDFNPVDFKESNKLKKYFIEFPQLIWSGINLFWQFITIKKKVNQFMDIYSQMFNKYFKYDLKNENAHKLVEIYYELEITVLRNWKAPIINDFMAMIFYGVLKLLIQKWKLDDTGSLQNELVAGQGNVESTLPLKKLQEIASFIRQYDSLVKDFKNLNEDELTKKFVGEACEAPQEYKKLCQMISQYLNDFGFRSMNELKLESPPLMEKPQFIFSVLKNYLTGPLIDPDEIDKKEIELRKNAERKVKQKLKGHPIRKMIFKFVVEFTKKAVAFREYQRFARTKMFGISRMIFIGIAHRFMDFGVIEEPDDIFYLTMNEIYSFITGTSMTLNLKGLISLRKKEYENYESADEPPDRIETFGPVYCNDFYFSRSSASLLNDEDPNVLKGISCCPGVVRGKVKVILNPSDNMSLNREILVASRTDPGWVPLYPSALGLLIERGSILSHSAIVARELGLPAIVGVPGLIKKLKTGDIVEMDGASGIIKIISEEK